MRILGALFRLFSGKAMKMTMHLLFNVLSLFRPFFLSTEGGLQWHRKCNSHVPLLYTTLLFLYNANYHTASFVPSKQQQPGNEEQNASLSISLGGNKVLL